MNHKYLNCKRNIMLSCAILSSIGVATPLAHAQDSDINVTVETNFAKEEAKLESQQKQIITSKDIEEKQAKSAEDIVFNETGVSRTVDAMGRVGVSIRGAEPRHTLILIDGQPAIGEFAKYMGQADELSRIGTENLDRIEITQGSASAKYGADAIGGVINVISKKPLDTPQFQINGESVHIQGASGVLPYSNFYMRADSGKLGKASFALWGSKRDVVPVYASKERLNKGLLWDSMENFEKNSLRFFGQSANIGVSSHIDLNKDNSLDVKADHYTDELRRYIKRTNSITEPSQDFKRNITRNNYNISYNGNLGEKTSLNATLGLSKVKEDDISMLNYDGKSLFEGNNILKYLDDIDHSRYDFKINATTAANDRHTLSYGIGFSQEKGIGSRLKNAPKMWEKTINPWNYDKSLLIQKGEQNQPDRVKTLIHDYKLNLDENNIPHWDSAYEWYNYDKSDKNSIIPAFTFEQNERSGLGYSALGYEHLTGEEKEAYMAFGKQLLEENKEVAKYLTGDDTYKAGQMINLYYSRNKFTPVDGMGNPITDSEGNVLKIPILFNGKQFKENYYNRDNKVSVGEATIRKQNIYISDDWQLDDNTIFTPSLRIDHSSLFGTNTTFNLGVTHNINSNPNNRLKANIGTGYTEPGMGELYYNWEMYSSAPISGGFGGGEARLGWYWSGNPNLKPEKSLNMDISLEGEKNKTSYRATLFRNNIKDYLSIYFTGHEMDFNPEYNDTRSIIGGARFLYAPDLIYSFKNIGRATITGLETEVKHKFNDHWSGRLGYTLLSAINKSDSTMPKHLLDKPQHKIDIGINYEDKKTGWSASLYGNYYIRMLDSNELTGKGNTIESYLLPNRNENDPNAEKSAIIRHYEHQTYKEKTYGIWNFIVQKKFNKDDLAYFAIDNVFNHRDDARALQGRVFRFGVNLKFGPDGRMHKYVKGENGKEIDLGPVELTDFFASELDINKPLGTKVIGEYSLASNVHGGSNRPQVRITNNSSIGSAAKNLLDKNQHGIQQKLSVGIDSHISKNTDIRLIGSLSNISGNPTALDVGSDKKSLNHAKLEEASVNSKSKKWDIALGKVKEKIGLTGYWFDSAFTGVKLQYTDKKNQVRIGYGDFSSNTGINDSAYTRATYQKFLRPITVDELTGPDYNTTDMSYLPKSDKVNFNKQLDAVSYRDDGNPDPKKQLEIVKRFYDIVTKAYPNIVNNNDLKFYLQFPTIKAVISYDKAQNGNIIEKDVRLEKDANLYGYMLNDDENAKKLVEISAADKKPLLNDGKEFIDSYFNKMKDNKDFLKLYENSIKNYLKPGNILPPDDDDDDDDDVDYSFISLPNNDNDDDDDFDPNDYSDIYGSGGGVNRHGSTSGTNSKPTDINNRLVEWKYNPDQYKKELFEKNYVEVYGDGLAAIPYSYFTRLKRALRATDGNSTNPRYPLSAVTGIYIPTQGIVLNSDSIPSINRALYIQALHKITPKLGISAWYLHSSKNKEYSYLQSDGGSSNKVYDFNQYANIIGLGLKYQLNYNASITLDYGRNYTPMGRFLNGITEYAYSPDGTSVKITGHKDGKTPSYYALRFNIGLANFDQPKSWSGFADYKYFEHGSFFGGNGTDSLPDRYLDGIKSFTVGGAYVPRKNMMIKASYTFGAEGINKRDTLFGPEKFKLGNYSRIEMLYKF